jgi:hypothetical protein
MVVLIINSGIYISKNPPILILYVASYEADSLTFPRPSVDF